MYKYVSRKEDEWASICITGGRYSGVIYQYGKVSLGQEENSEGDLPFRFEYNIIDNYGIDDINDDFQNLIGDILVDIIDDQMKEDNFEYLPNN